MPLTKPNKGSVLVFSLIVLSIVLSAALSVAVVNVSNRKSAGSTGQSVQSFQVADSGVELMLKKIYKDPTDVALSTLGTACAGGVVSASVSGGSVRVSFFDDANAQVTDCTSTTWRASLAKIKVEGTSAGTTRAIETAVAAATGDSVLTGWPDGILCTNGSDKRLLRLSYSYGGATNTTRYYFIVSGLGATLDFYTDTKAARANGGLTGYDCIGQPLSSLASQSFNFKN